MSQKLLDESQISVLVCNMHDPVSMEIANIFAIGNTKLDTLPYTTTFDDVLCHTRGVINKNTFRLFEMILPDFLPGKLEGLREKYPDLIVMNISDPNVALRLAELCCSLGIPLITLALFSEAECLKKSIEVSSIPAVVLSTEATAKTNREEQKKILIDGIRATALLAEKIKEGANGCFLRKDLPPT